MVGIPSGSQSKKRKHHSTEDPDTIHSVPKKKKEKRHKVPSASEDVLSRRHRPTSPKDKGKSRALDLPSEFHVINASLVLSISPVFASDLRAGVEEMLDSMVMRYIPSLQGVLLAHSNIRFLSQTASIHGDCPFAVCNVCFDATVWGPRVSMKLVGRINLCSPDHISLLVHRTFNVSIPRRHIPRDQWTFEYGPAENDPEYGGGRDWRRGSELDGAGEEDVGMIDLTGSKASGEGQEAESSGRWVHHLTGSRLGDPDGYVEFTVIGMTIANEMLSLQGSIQPDPFSPEHVPRSDRATPSLRHDQTSEAGARDGSSKEGEEEEEEGEGESDGDGFEHLAMLTNVAQATQKAERAKEQAERLEKAKKRKHGEDHHHGKRAERKRMKEITP